MTEWPSSRSFSAFGTARDEIAGDPSVGGRSGEWGPLGRRAGPKEFEPEEGWGWCYVDQVTLGLSPIPAGEIQE
jgi:hypothetical protein